MVLIIAGKYAIALLMRTVFNKPKNLRVIDAFLRSQITQIIKMYEAVQKDTTVWLKINDLMEYVLQHPDNYRG
jgi:dephospho-CoA kinase